MAIYHVTFYCLEYFFRYLNETEREMPSASIVLLKGCVLEQCAIFSEKPETTCQTPSSTERQHMNNRNSTRWLVQGQGPLADSWVMSFTKGTYVLSDISLCQITQRDVKPISKALFTSLEEMSTKR